MHVFNYAFRAIITSALLLCIINQFFVERSVSVSLLVAIVL